MPVAAPRHTESPTATTVAAAAEAAADDVILGWWWILAVITIWILISVIGQTVAKDFLARAGIAVGILSIAWKGTCVNRALVRASFFFPAAQRAWFILGAGIGAVALVASPILLAVTLASAVQRHLGNTVNEDFFESTVRPQSEPPKDIPTGVQLVPIIPGITVPWAHAVR